MIMIPKPQALALTCALFSEKVLGGDSDGNEFTDFRNAHFLDALRVAAPDLPNAYELTRRIPPIPPAAGPEDRLRKLHAAQTEARKKFADILHAMAAGMEDTSDMGEVPF